MKPFEVAENVGEWATINKSGDLLFDKAFTPFVKGQIPVRIVKLTRGGLAEIECNSPKLLTVVPPKNLDLIDAPEAE